jgi:hypothetical protein
MQVPCTLPSQEHWKLPAGMAMATRNAAGLRALCMPLPGETHDISSIIAKNQAVMSLLTCKRHWAAALYSVQYICQPSVKQQHSVHSVHLAFRFRSLITIPCRKQPTSFSRCVYVAADIDKQALHSHNNIQSPSAAHLPHSSDDSSATVRHDASSLKGCSSPSSQLTPTLSPSAARAVGQDTHRPPSALANRSPAASPVTPITPDQPSQLTAAAAATAVEDLQLEPLPAPDASEGAAAAAEYQAYRKRWEAGSTLAQRWSRSGPAAKGGGLGRARAIVWGGGGA